MPFSRNIDVDIDTGSWGRKAVPAWIGTNGVQSVNVTNALLLLGALTTPHALSAGSPERYWACVRYFSALTSTNDLRIQSAFLDLDPHQKGILSDDFGVAISTQWLSDRMGGFARISDGRKFAINNGLKKSASNIAKVGPGKCPDFVVTDRSGKFHVLECKGTQIGERSRDKAMENGLPQKRGIAFGRHVLGERLVAGLSLVGEASNAKTSLRIVDPVFAPVSEVPNGDAPRARDILSRLMMASALNLAGFPRTAFEMSWPTGFAADATVIPYLTKFEKEGLSQSRPERTATLRQEIATEVRTRPPRGQNFVVREVRLEIPAIEIEPGVVATTVFLRRGVNAQTILQLGQNNLDFQDVLDDQTPRGASAVVEFANEPAKARLSFADKFFTEMEFLI
ncbi:hypothetical protein WKW79_36545 [Variovorax robiniae]|uniref:Uncharacterized protein n=1 Tax=Variovorax robiniae TaxID=1836199 RepID=A0ABU8XKP2_9BURK